MILLCNECEKKFDSESENGPCPYCGATDGFSMIIIKDKNGNEETYDSYIKMLRRYYLIHTPEGMTKKEIKYMSASDLDDMNDIMNE